jgi:membrane-associated phospholipid phosphatase
VRGVGWRRRLALIAGFGAALLGGQARAASDMVPSNDSARSIYAIHPVVDGAVIAGGALATVIPYLYTSSLITPRCPCSVGEVSPFDRRVIGNASDVADWTSTVTVGLTLAAPPIADTFLVRDRRVLVEDFTVFAQAIAVNSALVTFAKFTVQRPIPRVYSDPALASSPSNYRSFYSGHTSLAFATLSVASVTANERYGLTWEPWAVTTAVGGSVAVERVLAGRHFYSDVIVGAAAGLLVGTTVSWVHLRERDLRISAVRARDGTGALLLVEGRF